MFATKLPARMLRETMSNPIYTSEKIALERQMGGILPGKTVQVGRAGGEAAAGGNTAWKFLMLMD